MKRNITLTRQEDKTLGDIHQCAGWIARSDGIAAWGATRQSAYGRVYREQERREKEAYAQSTEAQLVKLAYALRAEKEESDQKPVRDWAPLPPNTSGSLRAFTELKRDLDTLRTQFSAAELELIGIMCSDWRTGRVNADWRAVDALGRKLGVWE